MSDTKSPIQPSSAPAAAPEPQGSITPPLQASAAPSPQPPTTASIQQSINPPIHQSGPSSRRRRGKIARLPYRVRELVNLMLRDGLPYADITRKIAEHGYTLSLDSLSRWHSGGYQTWLREQELLDDQHACLHFATRVLNQKHSQAIQETSIRIAILRMYNLLLDFNPAVLKDRIAENPGAYARILNALSKLSSGAIQLERLRQNNHRK